MRPSTLAKWRDRADGARLDRVDLVDRRRRPRAAANRTPRDLEDLVLDVRKDLREHSDLGEYGAAAIRARLIETGVQAPDARTIGRILVRRGALDARRRIRRPPAPPGWYLPEVCAGRAELDSFDVVEDLVIEGGIHVDVLTGLSLHGGLAEAWPMPRVPATAVVPALISHWKAFGLPAFAQFDNDRRFQGPVRYPDSVGRVTRLCLSLGVAVVFAPPREHGPQSAVEGLNGLWQRKVWRRHRHADLAGLVARSSAWVRAHRGKRAARIDAAPPRRAFPAGWVLDLQAHPSGRVTFMRRTDDAGRVGLLGRTFEVDERWLQRLVRCDADLGIGRIRFFGLRRRDVTCQPLLRTVPYELPRRPFWEGHSPPPGWTPRAR